MVREVKGPIRNGSALFVARPKQRNIYVSAQLFTLKIDHLILNVKSCRESKVFAVIRQCNDWTHRRE